MRILFLTPRFPYPPLRGDQVRAYHQLRHLGRRHTVTLVALGRGRVSPAAITHVEGLCHRVIVQPVRVWTAAAGLGRVLIGDPRPLQTLLYVGVNRRLINALATTEACDLIHAQLLRTAGLIPQGIGIPVVLDLIDCLSASYARRMAIQSWWWRHVLAFEAHRLERSERAVLESGARCLLVSEAERRALGANGARAIVNPNGVELTACPFTPGRGRAGRIVFVGNLGYPPNADAIRWFVDAVLPRLQERRPGVELVIVGPRASRAVRALGRRPGVRLTGVVPDVHAVVADAQVAIAPLRAGGGLQNKVLEAMAAGTAVVATSLAVSGVATRPGEHCLVADTAVDFAAAVESLLQRDDLRLRLATAARELVVTRYAWERSVSQLESIYEATLAAAGKRNSDARGDGVRAGGD